MVGYPSEGTYGDGEDKGGPKLEMWGGDSRTKRHIMMSVDFCKVARASSVDIRF